MLIVMPIGALVMGFACVGCIMNGLGIWQAASGEASSPSEYYFFAGLCGIAVLLLLWGMNNGCSLVWVEDGVLYRRGLFFGNRRSCPIKDIQRVDTFNAGKGMRWLYIVDSQPGIYECMLKKSYICLADTEANRQFIRSFYK